ncbi:putative mitochondrial protein AtMg01250 [Apium graveolens]|uniref:putative mitochondrial protein AtMg01250 n=1 Tax=Apium graveolens TaxID=4045 RepID=UPI003D7B899D
MKRMGFSTMFINWVMKCITSCKLSVKVDGSIEGYFAAKSGLRQWDPLSPYLFVIAMEVMTACIKKSIATTDFSFHWLTKEASISHVTFADDVFLFSKTTAASLGSLMRGF